MPGDPVSSEFLPPVVLPRVWSSIGRRRDATSACDPPDIPQRRPAHDRSGRKPGTTRPARAIRASSSAAVNAARPRNPGSRRGRLDHVNGLRTAVSPGTRSDLRGSGIAHQDSLRWIESSDAIPGRDMSNAASTSTGTEPSGRVPSRAVWTSSELARRPNPVPRLMGGSAYRAGRKSTA